MPFEVPEGWCWCSISDICSKIGSGSTPRGSNYAEHGIPFFRSQNVYNDGLVYDDIKYISEDVHKSMIGTEVLPKDLLLNITGGSLGRCAVVPSDFERGNVSQHVCILRTVQVLPEYLHCFIISDYFSDTMILSGSGREGLPKYSLEAMMIPIPPLAEQSRIVSSIVQLITFVNSIEGSITDILQSVQVAKSKILDLAIRGKLVPQDANDEPASELLKRINPKAVASCDNPHYENVPYEIPSTWRWVKLGDIAQSNIGLTYKPSDITQDGVPVMRSNNIQNGVICNDEIVRVNTKLLDSQVLNNGDLLICARNGSKKLVGKCALVNNLQETTSFGAFMAVCRSDMNNWLYHVLSSEYFKNYLDDSNSTTIHQVTQKMLLAFEIPLPPLREQDRIYSKIKELYNFLDNITDALS